MKIALFFLTRRVALMKTDHPPCSFTNLSERKTIYLHAIRITRKLFLIILSSLRKFSETTVDPPPPKSQTMHSCRLACQDKNVCHGEPTYLPGPAIVIHFSDAVKPAEEEDDSPA